MEIARFKLQTCAPIMQGLYSLPVLVGAWTVARGSLQGPSQLAFYTWSGDLTHVRIYNVLTSKIHK
jgi:hypothetical protein